MNETTDDVKTEVVEQAAKAVKYSQEEANYLLESPTPNEHCASCRWFIVSGSECHIVNGTPLPIVATGKSDYYTPYPVPEAESSLEEALEEFMGSAELKEKIEAHDTSVHVNSSTPNTFMRWLKSLVSKKSDDEQVGFKVIGNRWIATYSNNFEDLDGEYFPEKAIDEFIDRVDRKEVAMPELWYWHTPVAIGDADAIGRVENFVVATGEFRKDKVSQAFKEHFKKTSWKYRVSHGFRYPSGGKVDKAYRYFDTFEISPLREGKEANPYTDFELGVSDMGGWTPEKQKEFEAFLTPDLLDEYVKRLSEKSKELIQKGVDYKERPQLDVVDATARTEIGQVKSSVDSLTEQIETLVKALTPADKAKEAEDAKEEKRLADFKKEVADLVESRMKSFMDLTPRRASKDAATAVDGTHEHVKHLIEGQETGEVAGDKQRLMRDVFPMLYQNKEGN